MPNNPTIVYEKRLVALLDIMGFKEMLKDGDTQELQRYYDQLFEEMDSKQSVYNVTATEDSFKKLIVSDSVLLSVKICGNDQEKLNKTSRFLQSVGLIQYLLAVKADIWCRGSVAYGNLFIDENTNTLVGPAFVTAYELEKASNYPRVIVHPKICSMFEEKLKPNDLVKKVNLCGHGNVLLDFTSSPRFGRRSFDFDSLQIDWFKNDFTRSYELKKFFSGIEKRITIDQNLFEKTNLLLKYLRESYDIENNKQDKISGVEDRLKVVNSYLQSFGI